MTAYRCCRRVSIRQIGLLLAIAAFSVALLAAVAAPDARAHTASIGSQHSLALASGLFLGQLTSEAADCASGRSITLYRSGASGDTAVATATTNAEGAWSPHGGGPPAGDYYAVAAARLVKQPGHKHSCGL